MSEAIKTLLAGPDFHLFSSESPFLSDLKLHRWTCLSESIHATTFYSTEFTQLNCLNSVFADTRFIDCRFSDVTLNSSTWTQCYFENVEFDKIVLRNNQFIGCTFFKCKFRALDSSTTSIENNSFTTCYFNECDLGEVPSLLQKSQDGVLKENAFKLSLFRFTPISADLLQGNFLLQSQQTTADNGKDEKSSELITKAVDREPPVNPPIIPAIQPSGRFTQLEI